LSGGILGYDQQAVREANRCLIGQFGPRRRSDRLAQGSGEYLVLRLAVCLGRSLAG
jgi:hypothetical protein